MISSTESLDREHLLLSGRFFAGWDWHYWVLADSGVTGVYLFWGIDNNRTGYLGTIARPLFHKMIPLQSAEHKKAASCRGNKDLEMSQHIHSLPERSSIKFLPTRRSNDLMLGYLLFWFSQEKTDGRMKLEMCKIQINTEDNLVQADESSPFSLWEARKLLIDQSET